MVWLLGPGSSELASLSDASINLGETFEGDIALVVFGALELLARLPPNPGNLDEGRGRLAVRWEAAPGRAWSGARSWPCML